MKKTILVSILLTALFFVGCQNETPLLEEEGLQEQQNDSELQKPGYITLQASMASSQQATDTRSEFESLVDETAPASRVGFDPNGKFYWSNGDAIGVPVSTHPDRLAKLTLVKGAGTGTATFQCKGTGTVGKYALYPYNAADKIEGNKATVHIGYDVTLSDKDANPAENVSNADNSNFNALMYGKISGNHVSFKHLGGVLHLLLYDLPKGEIIVEVDSKEISYGDFTVDLSSEEPQISKPQDIASFIRSVTFKNTRENENSSEDQTSSPDKKSLPNVVNLPMPVGTFHNVSVTVYHEAVDEGCKLFVRSLGDLTFKRRSVKTVPLSKPMAYFADTSDKKVPYDEMLCRVKYFSNIPIEVQSVYNGKVIDTHLGHSGIAEPIGLSDNDTDEIKEYQIELVDAELLKATGEREVLATYTVLQSPKAKLIFKETGTNKGSTILPYSADHIELDLSINKELTWRLESLPNLIGIEHPLKKNYTRDAFTFGPGIWERVDVKSMVIRFYDREFEKEFTEHNLVGEYTITKDMNSYSQAEITIDGKSGDNQPWIHYDWLGKEVFLPVQVWPYVPLSQLFRDICTPIEGGSKNIEMKVYDYKYLKEDTVSIKEHVDGNDVKAGCEFGLINPYNTDNFVKGEVYFKSVAWLYIITDPRKGKIPVLPLNMIQQTPNGNVTRTFNWRKLDEVFYFKMHYARDINEYEAAVDANPESTYSKESYVPTSEYTLTTSSPLLQIMKDRLNTEYYKLSLTGTPKKGDKATFTYTCGTNKQVFTIVFLDDEMGGTGEDCIWE